MLFRKKATDILNGAAAALSFATSRKKTDALTRLKNVYALKKEFAKTDAKCVLALINLDRFSGVNAAYGIDVGDMLLVRIGVGREKISPRCRICRMNAGFK